MNCCEDCDVNIKVLEDQITQLTERCEQAEAKACQYAAGKDEDGRTICNTEAELDRLEGENEDLQERCEKAEAALKPNNPAGESRLIRTAISRLMAGESAESVARDYGLDADTFRQVAELQAKVKEIEGVLWYIKVENSYCVVCLEDHPEYEDDMTDNDYLKTCKPDCKLAAVLTQDTQQEKPECELREGEHGPFRHNGGWWVGEYGHAAQPGVMTPTREIQDTQPDTDHRKNHPACRECEYRDRCVESPAPSVGGRVEKKTDCCWYWDNHPDHPDTQPESTKEKLAKDVEAEWQKWLDDIQQVSPPESFLDSIASLCQSILGREITVENTTDTQPPKPCSAPLMSDYLAIKDAATKLLEACEHQDNCENLCEKIDGDLLDNLRVAIGKKYIVKPSEDRPECGGWPYTCDKCKPDQEV